jgi:hypothetical protein
VVGNWQQFEPVFLSQLNHAVAEGYNPFLKWEGKPLCAEGVKL